MTPTPEEIEAIARSIYEAEGGTRWGEIYEGTKDDYRYVSRAAWHAARPGIRREALEEAARVAENHKWPAEPRAFGNEIAAAIRALKDQP